MSKDTQKWYGLINNQYWEIQKLSDRVKMFSEYYEFHYRFGLIEWETIRRQFVYALRNSRNINLA